MSQLKPRHFAAALAGGGVICSSAALLNLNLLDGSDLDLLREIKRRQPYTMVMMMTVDMLVENAIAAPRRGIDDLIGTPVNLGQLQFTLDHGIEATGQRQEVVAASKPRLLIVSDAPDRLNNLRAAFSTAEVEIASVTPQGLRLACGSQYDLAVVDVGPVQLIDVLKTMRANNDLSEIPVLVDVSRITAEPVPAGVLPKYRAMPCSPSELVTLARRRLTAMTGRWQARRLL